MLTKTSSYPNLNQIKLQLEKMNKNNYYDVLVKKRHDAEKNNQDYFSEFNDLDMIFYYIHHRKSLSGDKERSENTKKEYERELLQFATNLVKYQESIGIDIDEVKEGSLFKSLSPRHIEKYQIWLAEKYPYIIGRNSVFSAATLSRKTTIIKSFLMFLYRNGYIEKDLTLFIKSASVKKDERPNKDLSPGEVLKLLDYFYEVDPHPIVFAILHILVTTGIRNSELCQANVGDIIFDEHRKVGNRSGYFLYVKGKGNKKRYVALSNKVMESIHTFREIRFLPHINSADPNEPLITTSTGKRFSNSYLSQYIHKAVQRADLAFIKNKENPITPHTFRHAFAILSYHQGVDVYTISRSLGHDNFKTTEIYLEKEFEKDNFSNLAWNKGDITKYL